MAETNVQINPLIFREYDVRGLVGSELNPQAIYLLGQAIGTFTQNNGGKRLAVGQDNRTSSTELKAALINGLVDSGCDVFDIGLSTSPVLYISVIQWNLDGGINVTGSHNPVQYNGFKITKAGAEPLTGQEIKSLYALIADGKLKRGQGSVTKRDPKPEYFDRLARLVHLERPLKVVLDTGNGIAGAIVPEMLKRLGCEVIGLFTELDGSFPNHLPNPEHEENLADLKRVVVERKADIGLGYDGDGDRIGIVDENGKFMSSDYTLMLLARDYLSRHPGDKILIDIKSSRNVDFDIRRHTGVPVVWKTGHSLMKAKMRADHITMGGEFSGHMFDAEDYYVIDDALYAGARILEYLSRNSMPVSEYFKDLPRLYSTPLLEVHIDEASKFETIQKLVEIFRQKYEVIDIDGAKVILPDGWGLVRASNTTPTLNLRFEAETPEALERIKGMVFDTLKQFPDIRF